MSKHFLERLTVVYGEPETDNQADFFDEYRRALNDFDADTMDRAVDRMLRDRKFRSWPTIGELKRHASQALAEAKPAHQPYVGPTKKDEAWSKEFLAKAYDLIKSPLGVRAGEEGWILALWHFCRRNQRLPKNTEIADVKREASRFDEIYATVCAGGFPMAAALRRLGESMIERRQKLADIAAESQGLTEASRRMTGDAA